MTSRRDDRRSGTPLTQRPNRRSNARIQAEIRGRLAELEASRRRIVEAADLQRQRLERDVSAGPLARLERTEMALRELGASLDGSASSSLLGAETELANALTELKGFARGVYPIALIRDGFRGALSSWHSEAYG